MTNWNEIKKIIIPEGEVSIVRINGEVVWYNTRLNPTEYHEVEYLESTGTQWIDTELTINTDTDEIELIFQNTESNIYKWIFGEHDSGARLGVGSGDGVNKRNVAYGINTYKVNDETQYNRKHFFVVNSNGVFLDNVSVRTFSSFSSVSTLYLFNLNITPAGNYTGSAKIWSYKHKRNGQLIRELIPCYRVSDNELGMYDTVSKTFFTNKGTGTFLTNI